MNIVAITPSKSGDHCCDGCHNNCSICLEAMKTPSGSIMTSCNVCYQYITNINMLSISSYHNAVFISPTYHQYIINVLSIYYLIYHQYIINIIINIINANNYYQHEFHYLCLQEAKLMKSECPLCRCPLTPPVGSNSPMMTINFQQQHSHITMIPREFIVRRSREAREAVQLAMTQRLERIRQGQLEVEQQQYQYQQTVLQQ